MYSHFFTTFEQTEPPKILPEGYQEVKDNYDRNFEYVMQIPEQDYTNIDFGESTDLQESELEKASSVVDTARKYLGGKYKYGGTDPNTGVDCSGFLQYVYKQHGIKLPRTVSEISKIGLEVPSLNDIQKGDLICMTSSNSPSGNHIEMVSRVENGDIFTIEAKNSKSGIVETKFNPNQKYTTIRRIVNSDTPKLNGREEYIQMMYPQIYKALQDNDIDPDKWAGIVTAQTAHESGWGNAWSRKHNNYAGIKGSGTGPVSTKELGNDGYYTTKSSFKTYATVRDFANDFVKMLKNKFNAFSTQPQYYAYNLKKNRYFTDDSRKYQKSIDNITKTIEKYV